MSTIEPPSLDLTDIPSTFFDDPYPTYRRLREEDPVHWSDHWGAWIVTRYDDVVKVLQDHRQFSNVSRHSTFMDHLPLDLRERMRPYADHFKTGLISSDPPHHTRFRGVVKDAFARPVIERLRPRVQSIVDDLLDSAVEKGEVDLVRDFAFLLPTAVITQLLGVPLEHRFKFDEWATPIFDFQGTARATPRHAIEAREGIIAFRKYYRDLLDERHRFPREDIMTRLAQAEYDGTLNEDEVLSICVTLLLAGYGTTMSLIGNSVHSLLRHPDQHRSLRENPCAIVVAMEELLRFESPVGRQNRVAVRDLELGGKKIRKGDLVATLLGAANHDPEHFVNPDNLDLTRSDNKHVAFGVGIHFCLGAPLGRLEGQVAVQTLVQRFPNLRLAETPAVWRQDITIRGLQTLPVVLN
jgi:cytochrome P450